MTITPSERRARKRLSQRNSDLRKRGMSIPFTRRGRPIEHMPRCPVCGEIISAQKDCRCP